MNILVLDDEKEIADLVELYLLNDGYQVFKYYHPKEAIECIDTKELDMAILDIMLPEVSGFEICKDIRQKGYSYPILMLTAKVEDIDKIKGLSLGADDYITKPFNPLEFMARVKAALRRYKKYNLKEQEDILDIMGLVLNAKTHTCTLYGKKIELTPLEFSILMYLGENRGKVVSSEELFEKVWKEKYLDSNNTIMVHIRRIRDKLGDSSKNAKFIKTVWGVGYKIEK